MSTATAQAPPRVTLVICAYNAGPSLRAAVEAARAQRYPHLEILVVNDGSTDDSVSAVRALDDPRLRVLDRDHRGVAAARNAALDAMRGELYAILDADDTCSPDRVDAQVRVMREDPTLAAVFCGHRLVLDERPVAPRFAEKDVEACARDLEALRMPAHDPTGMFRTALARKVRYSESLPIGSGYDFILRLGERSPRMRVLGACLYAYTVRKASLTRADPERRLRAVYEVQRAACERRGQPAPAPPLPRRRYRNREIDNNLAAHFMESARDLRRAGRWREAISVGLACARLHPLDPHYWKALVYALRPRPRPHAAGA